MRKDFFSCLSSSTDVEEPWEVQGSTLLSKKMVICQMLFQVTHSYKWSVWNVLRLKKSKKRFRETRQAAPFY